MILRVPTFLAWAVAAMLMVQPLSITPSVAQNADRVMVLFQDGDTEAALAEALAVLKDSPNEPRALFVAARVNQDQGRLTEALRHAEAFARHHPGLVLAWEVALQVYQATGDRPQRDWALKQLIATQAASLDRGQRGRQFIIRDRFAAFGHVVLVQEHFDTGGPDSVRFVFLLEKEAASPRNVLVVQTDSHTTENWREAGILAPGRRLFHLDSIFETRSGAPGHNQELAMYATWPDPPDYDTVRAKVHEIMSGKIKPMSGPVGGLTVPAQGTGSAAK